MEMERLILANLVQLKSHGILVNKSISSRGDSNLTEMEAYQDTISHRDDVRRALGFICNELMLRAEMHDHTKLDNIEDFVHDLKRDFKGDDLRGWWELHLTERHHLNSHVPDDVNLFDVIECLADCCVAGAARDGAVSHVKLSPELLVKAFDNTRELLCKNITVSGKELEDK